MVVVDKYMVMEPKTSLEQNGEFKVLASSVEQVCRAFYPVLEEHESFLP